MTYRLGAGLLIVSMSLAYSERTLSPDNAAKSISALDGFKREAHFWIQTGAPLRSAFSCYTQAEVERTPLNQFVAARGWVRYESREAVIGFGTKASCPAMALTPAGEAASAQWTRRRVALNQGTAWAVPIGRREFLGVTEVEAAADGSTQVEFDWRWVPNEIGAALRTSVPLYRAYGSRCGHRFPHDAGEIGGVEVAGLGAADDHDRNAARLGAGLQFFPNVTPAETRQPHVENNQARGVALNPSQGVDAVFDGGDGIPRDVQGGPVEGSECRIVLDDQDGRPAGRGSHAPESTKIRSVPKAERY